MLKVMGTETAAIKLEQQLMAVANRNEQRRKAAIEWMGPRHILHHSHQVQKRLTK